MTADELRAEEDAAYRAGQDIMAGLARGIQSSDSPRAYTITFLDNERMHQTWVSQYVISNMDVKFLEDMLANQPPEFRTFILDAAELICEAGRGLRVPEMSR